MIDSILTIYASSALERLLDWFLMAFINGARAKFNAPKQRSEQDPEIWEKVIRKAEDAHWALREGARLAEAKEWTMAEEFARMGIELISEWRDWLIQGLLTNVIADLTYLSLVSSQSPQLTVRRAIYCTIEGLKSVLKKP
jgi:hypothetical protein